MPALPLDEAGKYVAAAYIVFFTLIVLYVAIISAKVARIDRELTDLVEIAERDDEPATRSDEPERDGEPVA
jgi:CcmD family protein